MSVGTAIVAVLKNDADVANIVVDKIYRIDTHPGTQAPYVVYEQTAGVPVESPSPGVTTWEYVIDVASYGREYAESRELSEAVGRALINGLGASVIEDENDFRDDATQRKSVVQTYRIWHDETFP